MIANDGSITSGVVYGKNNLECQEFNEETLESLLKTFN